jgi:hypothetical protein
LDLTKIVELLSNEVVAYQDANQTLVNELRNLEILVERYLKIEVMHFLSFLNFQKYLNFFLIGLN